MINATLRNMVVDNSGTEAMKRTREEKVSPEQNAAVTASEDATTLNTRRIQEALDFCYSKAVNSEKKPFTLQDYRRYVKSEVLPERCLEIRHLALDGTGEMLPTKGIPAYFDHDWLNDKALAEILSHFPNLETLQLGGQKLITDKGFEKISTLVPKLRILTTYQHKKITDVGLSFLKRLPLDSLYLGRGKWESQITDVGLRHVSEIRSLKAFSISESITITDLGVRDLCTLPLTTLHLAACNKLTDASIKSIAQIGTLETLDISGSPSSIPGNITEAGIANLKNHPKLQQIEASWVPGIDKEAIARLKALGIPMV